MKIPTRVRYAARTLAQLAGIYPEAASARQLAEDQKLSIKYLEQIMASLKAAGIVKAERGSHGGYALASPPESIRLIDVFRALNGKLALVECVEHAEDCPMQPVCPTRDTWLQVKDAMEKVLSGTTLRDLAERRKQKGSLVAVGYDI